MKGLLFKEFYLTRKTYLGFFGLFLGVASLCALAALSMVCGNLREIAMEEPETVNNYFQMFSYIPLGMLVFAVQSVETSVYMDYASGWMKYSYSAPLPAGKVIGVRYLAGLIILMISMVFGFASAGLMGMILSKPVTIDMIKNMLVIGIFALGVLFIDIPLALKYTTAQKVQNLEGTFFLVGYIVVVGTFFKNLAELDEQSSEQYMAELMAKAIEIRDILLPLSPIILLLLFAISYRLSVRFYQRREK